MTKTAGKKVSAGIHSNVKPSTVNAMRGMRKDLGIKQMNISKAWREGKNPWVTIDNPNAANEPGKLRIRVKADHAWGKYHKDPIDKKGAKKELEAA